MQHTDARVARAARRGAIAAGVAALAIVLTGCPVPPGTSTPTTVPAPAGATVVDISPTGGDLFLESEVGSPSVVLYDRLTTSGGRVWLYDDATRTRTDLGIPFPGSQQVSASADGQVVVYSSRDPQLQSGPLAANCQVRPAPFTPLQTAYCAELYLLDRSDGTTRPLTGVGGSSTTSSSAPIVAPDGASVTFLSTTGPESTPVRLVMDVATGEISPAPPLPEPDTWDHGPYHLTWTYADGLVRTDTTTGDAAVLSPGGSNTPWDRSADGRYVVMGSSATGFRVLDVVDGSERTIPVPDIDDDATRYVGVLYVDAPGIDRLVTGDIPPEA